MKNIFYKTLLEESMKKIFAIIICLFTILNCMSFLAYASIDEMIDNNEDDSKNEAIDTVSLEINAKSAILMDAETGTVLYMKNASEPLPPASVTKIMTLLLVAEAIDSG